MTGMSREPRECSAMRGDSRLTVIRRLLKGHRAYYECLCSCGAVKIIRADNVKSGSTLSCGCLSREKVSARLKKLHRGKDTPEQQ